VNGMSKRQGCARRFSDSHDDIKVHSLLRKLLIFHKAAFLMVNLQQEGDKLTGKLRINSSCSRFAAKAAILYASAEWYRFIGSGHAEHTTSRL
jgi:hypothetical protein